MSTKTALSCCLFGAAFAAFAQAPASTPSEPNCGPMVTAPRGESTRDRAEVRAEGKAAANAADTRSGAQCDNPARPAVTSGTRSRAEVRAEGRNAKTAPVEGGGATTN